MPSPAPPRAAARAWVALGLRHDSECTDVLGDGPGIPWRTASPRGRTSLLLVLLLLTPRPPSVRDRPARCRRTGPRRSGSSLPSPASPPYAELARLRPARFRAAGNMAPPTTCPHPVTTHHSHGHSAACATRERPKAGARDHSAGIVCRATLGGGEASALAFVWTSRRTAWIRPAVGMEPILTTSPVWGALIHCWVSKAMPTWP